MNRRDVTRCRRISRRRPFDAAVLVLATIVLAPSVSAPARSADVFEVGGVAVDETAETAAMAREQALAAAERRAFRRLLERLTLGSDYDRLPRDMPQEEISAYVLDFSVEDEKTSPVRYLARLNYRFKPDDVRALLRAYDLPFAETPSKPVLVLPVYQAAGALLLWDEPNPWREAWTDRPSADALVPIVAPLGDLADMRAIGAEQALDGDQQRLTAVARRYGAGDAMVVFAVLGLDPLQARHTVDVTVTRYGSGLDSRSFASAYTSLEGERLEALLRRAAADAIRQVQDEWKRDNLLQLNRSGVIAVTVPVGGLKDWLAVKRRITDVAVVRRTELVLVSREEIRANLHFVGQHEQLVLALRQADLTLDETDGEWVLRIAGGQSASGS